MKGRLCNETKERGQEKHQEGGVGRKKKTHHRTSAKICTDRLCRWSRQIEDWAKDLASIYIYFDNDQAGYAARNALELKRLVNGSNSRAEKAYVA